MPAYSPENTPAQNLEALSENEYPGRVLVIGRVGPIAVQAYGLMGRSDDSRNRILVEEDAVVSTETFDRSKEVERPDLTIYDAMRRTGTSHIVSNGNQTSTVIEYLRAGRSFEDAVESRDHEDDKPNFTPRITGIIDIAPSEDRPAFALSLNGETDKKLFLYDAEDMESDTGLALQTYEHNVPKGEKLPSFAEEPFALPVYDTASAMAWTLWSNLNPENRVAVAAKTIDTRTNEVEYKVFNALT